MLSYWCDTALFVSIASNVFPTYYEKISWVGFFFMSLPEVSMKDLSPPLKLCILFFLRKKYFWNLLIYKKLHFILVLKIYLIFACYS